jgi:hypothetical protein
MGVLLGDYAALNTQSVRVANGEWKGTHDAESRHAE